MYLHDVNVSADVWEALDTERRAEREEPPGFHDKEKVAVFCCTLSWRKKETVCA